MACIVVANAAALVLETDFPGLDWDSVECVFLAVYLTESLLRAVILCPHAFVGSPDFAWNLFDQCIVAVGMLEIILNVLFAIGRGSDNSNMVAARNFLRLLRVMRILRLARFLRRLQSLNAGFALACPAAFWASLLVCLATYVLSVVLVQIFPGRAVLENSGSLPGRAQPITSGARANGFLQIALALLGLAWRPEHPDQTAQREGLPEYPLALASLALFGRIAVFALVTGLVVAVALERGQQMAEEARSEPILAMELQYVGTVMRERMDQCEATLHQVMKHTDSLRELREDVSIATSSLMKAAADAASATAVNVAVVSAETLGETAERLTEDAKRESGRMRDDIAAVNRLVVECQQAVDRHAQDAAVSHQALLKRAQDVADVQTLVLEKIQTFDRGVAELAQESCQGMHHKEVKDLPMQESDLGVRVTVGITAERADDEAKQLVEEFVSQARNFGSQLLAVVDNLRVDDGRCRHKLPESEKKFETAPPAAATMPGCVSMTGIYSTPHLTKAPAMSQPLGMFGSTPQLRQCEDLVHKNRMLLSDIQREFQEFRGTQMRIVAASNFRLLMESRVAVAASTAAAEAKNLVTELVDQVRDLIEGRGCLAAALVGLSKVKDGSGAVGEEVGSLLARDGRSQAASARCTVALRTASKDPVMDAPSGHEATILQSISELPKEVRELTCEMRDLAQSVAAQRMHSDDDHNVAAKPQIVVEDAQSLTDAFLAELRNVIDSQAQAHVASGGPQIEECEALVSETRSLIAGMITEFQELRGVQSRMEAASNSSFRVVQSLVIAETRGFVQELMDQRRSDIDNIAALTSTVRQLVEGQGRLEAEANKLSNAILRGTNIV